MISVRPIHVLYAALIATLFLCVFVQRASAHISGASFSATTSPYVIDIGYDPIQFVAGQSSRFDFVLSDEKTNDRKAFDQVWVRIVNDDGTQLATGLFRQPFGPTTLLYVFAEPGMYTLEPSFRDAAGNEIASASFPITVTESEDAQSPLTRYGTFFVLFVVGCALGAAGMRAAGRRS